MGTVTASTLSSAPRTTHPDDAAPDRLASPPARQSPRPARRAGPAGRPRASRQPRPQAPRTAAVAHPAFKANFERGVFGPGAIADALHAAADHHTADCDAHPSSPVSLARAPR